MKVKLIHRVICSGREDEFDTIQIEIPDAEHLEVQHLSKGSLTITLYDTIPADVDIGWQELGGGLDHEL